MKVWTWIKGKFGRITTALGSLMTLADIDISPVRPQLEDIFSHKGVQVITLLLFLFSFWRHHSVAQLHRADPRAP